MVGDDSVPGTARIATRPLGIGGLSAAANEIHRPNNGSTFLSVVAAMQADRSDKWTGGRAGGLADGRAGGLAG